eukprot:1674569-Rhodomonas_salina.3
MGCALGRIGAWGVETGREEGGEGGLSAGMHGSCIAWCGVVGAVHRAVHGMWGPEVACMLMYVRVWMCPRAQCSVADMRGTETALPLSRFPFFPSLSLPPSLPLSLPRFFSPRCSAVQRKEQELSRLQAQLRHQDK